MYQPTGSTGLERQAVEDDEVVGLLQQARVDEPALGQFDLSRAVDDDLGLYARPVAARRRPAPRIRCGCPAAHGATSQRPARAGLMHSSNVLPLSTLTLLTNSRPNSSRSGLITEPNSSTGGRVRSSLLPSVVVDEAEVQVDARRAGRDHLARVLAGTPRTVVGCCVHLHPARSARRARPAGPSSSEYPTAAGHAGPQRTDTPAFPAPLPPTGQGADSLQSGSSMPHSMVVRTALRSNWPSTCKPARGFQDVSDATFPSTCTQ